MNTPGAVPAPHDEDEEEGGGFDARQIVDYLSYVGRALRLHWRRAGGLFLLIGGAAVALSTLLPKTYLVETTLLAQNNQVIAALGNPSRSFPREDLAPTRAVAETVQNRDNLIALVRQTGLVEYWKQHRPPLSRFKAWVMGVFRRPLDDDALVDVLVFLLEQRLVAWAHENKITIALTWDDPVMALRLLEAAQQNFLETRHVTDTAIIAESISILEGHMATARQEADEAMAAARVRRVAARAAGGDGGVQISYPSAPGAEAGGGGNNELARLRVLIGTKRRGVSDLEGYRRQRLGELQSQLAEQRAVYAESHPVIVNLLQSIEALGQDSPQLAALRRELHELEAQYVAKGGMPGELDAQETAAPPRFLPTIVTAPADSASRRDPAEDYAQSRLGAAITRYNVLVDRLASARMELDAARAAFKYRYTVIQPPLPPKKPAGGKARLLGMAGVAFGLVAGLLAAVLAEARKGLIVQAWQVERQLGLPILTELPPG